MDTPPQDNVKKPEPIGPIVGVVIIVLVLLAGGIYFLLLQQQENEQPSVGEEQARL